MENVFFIIINSNMNAVEWLLMNVYGKIVIVNMLLVQLIQLHHHVALILVFGMGHLVYIVQ